jgi:carboxylesterase type B
MQERQLGTLGGRNRNHLLKDTSKYFKQRIGQQLVRRDSVPHCTLNTQLHALTRSNCRESPAGWQFPAGGLGNEDCLSLSVFAPEDAANFPVMVFIRKYFCLLK